MKKQAVLPHQIRPDLHWPKWNSLFYCHSLWLWQSQYTFNSVFTSFYSAEKLKSRANELGHQSSLKIINKMSNELQAESDKIIPFLEIFNSRPAIVVVSS